MLNQPGALERKSVKRFIIPHSSDNANILQIKIQTFRSQITFVKSNRVRFPRPCSSSGSRVIRRFVENIGKGKNFTFDDLTLVT